MIIPINSLIPACYYLILVIPVAKVYDWNLCKIFLKEISIGLDPNLLMEYLVNSVILCL